MSHCHCALLPLRKLALNVYVGPTEVDTLVDSGLGLGAPMYSPDIQQADATAMCKSRREQKFFYKIALEFRC